MKRESRASCAASDTAAASSHARTHRHSTSSNLLLFSVQLQLHKSPRTPLTTDDLTFSDE
uniref:Uncharacterized protein n=1 Tax=Arundo donax TaxID=35708 RepID=A0A0A9PG67_ARUDO